MVEHVLILKARPFRKNRRVRLKHERRAVALARPDFFHRFFWFAAYVLLLPHAAVALDRNFKLFGKRVHDGYADTVQTAGNLVAAVFAAKFAAGVQLGHDQLKRGNFVLLVRLDRNASAVIGYGNAVARKQRDDDLIGMSGHRFVKRVVRHFAKQVKQTFQTG